MGLIKRLFGSLKRKKKSEQKHTGTTMKSILKSYDKNLYGTLDEKSKKEIIETVLKIESDSQKTRDPLRFIRERIMGTVDESAIYNAIIKYCIEKLEGEGENIKLLVDKLNKINKILNIEFSPETGTKILVLTNISNILRDYSCEKFGDLIFQNDWFDHYVQASTYVYDRTILAIITDKPHIVGLMMGADVMGEISKVCLDAPVGKRFKATFNDALALIRQIQDTADNEKMR